MLDCECFHRIYRLFERHVDVSHKVPPFWLLPYWREIQLAKRQVMKQLKWSFLNNQKQPGTEWKRRKYTCGHQIISGGSLKWSIPPLVRSFQLIRQTKMFSQFCAFSSLLNIFFAKPQLLHDFQFFGKFSPSPLNSWWRKKKIVPTIKMEKIEATSSLCKFGQNSSFFPNRPKRSQYRWTLRVRA